MLPWFTKYPNQNDEILNLDWVIRQVENLKAAYEAFLAANSLTFADPIVWDITKQYSKNTIVLSPEGDAFLSKKAVGAGIQLNNSDYWLEIFNFADYVRTANSNLTIHIEQNTTRATAAYAVDDWLLWEDVLYKVTSVIAVDDLLTVGTNIVHFTVEDFCRTWQTYLVNTIDQYKRDIDASELAYKQQLDQTVLQYKNDIDASESAFTTQINTFVNTTTASLQAQLDAAIAGATVDSEVINARIGSDGTTYTTLGNAIRYQFDKAFSSLELNYDNVVTDTVKASSVNGGVTYTYNADGTYTVAGTQSGVSFHNLSDGSIIPEGIKEGETYFVLFDTSYTDVYFEIWTDQGRLFGQDHSYWFTVPLGITYLYARLSTWNASGINSTCKIPIVSSLKNLTEKRVIPRKGFNISNLNKALSLSDVILEAGEYTIPSTINIPENGSLEGSGASTILKYTGSNNCIYCQYGGETIKNLTIDGGGTTRPANYSPAEPHRAIYIYGSDTYGMNPTFISNVSCIGFNKDGIAVENKGYVALNSVMINNCYFRFNGSGITMGEKGEYAVISNCVSIDNYFGIVASGGNNKISNCGFDRNVIGLFATNVNNDTHSDVVGCSFNHNAGYGVNLYQIASTLTFTGCNFYGNGTYHVADVEAFCVSFDNCQFGTGAVSFKKGATGGLKLLSGCIFITTPTINAEDSPIIVFDNCYLPDGTPVTAP